MDLLKMSFQANLVITQDKHAKKLRTLATRMAVTNPRDIFDRVAWKGPRQLSQDITQAWVAATTLFGDIWKKTASFDISKETRELMIDNNESNKTKDNNNGHDLIMKERKKRIKKKKKETIRTTPNRRQYPRKERKQWVLQGFPRKQQIAFSSQEPTQEKGPYGIWKYNVREERKGIHNSTSP
jgi:hypothetical protein